MNAETHACLTHQFNCIFWKVVWCNLCVFLRSCSCGRWSAWCCDHPRGQGTVHGSPQHFCTAPQRIFPQKQQQKQQKKNVLFSVSLHLSLPFSLIGFELDLQYLGWPCTRGHLAEEWTWDGFGRSLHSEVWVRQVCQFHHHQRQYGWLRKVQHPGKEQVRYGERRFHRKCLHPRRGTRQEKIKKITKSIRLMKDLKGFWKIYNKF